jgi:hypothetical protein
MELTKINNGRWKTKGREIVEAAPGEHRAKARRIAVNFAKLPELLREA